MQMSTTSREADGSPKWTVMVFMGADGVEGNISLAEAKDADILEMERALQRPDSDEKLKIFVQVHGDGAPTRRQVGRGHEPVPGGQQNATNGEALLGFIRWAVRAAGHDPRRDYSMLVLWGHAYRFAIGHAETRAGIDALDFAELAEVLRRLQEEYRQAQNMQEMPRLDIVGFDACDIATVEMAVQLEQFAKFLLASQIGIPLPGWPYDKVLDRLAGPEGDVMDPAELGTYIVRRYCEAYHAQERTVSLSLLNLQGAHSIADRVELLARKLAIAVAHDRAEREVVYDALLRAQTDEDKPFVDVADLCLTLMRQCSDPFVTDAAERLGNLLITPPQNAFRLKSADGQRRPFVVEHGRNAAGAARLHGVSLYAPHLASRREWMDASHWYRKFVFSQNTMWNALVHALAQGMSA
jgi:hypothetical protein